jgi:ABC-type glutathione transport system ATPase component
LVKGHTVARDPVLLDVQSLRVGLPAADTADLAGPLLDDVSLSLHAGERVAVVGGSGAGKSMLALALMGLLREPLAVCGGRVLWRGRDLLTLVAADRHALRGRELFLVFQSPGSSLDPLLTIERQLTQCARRAGVAPQAVADRVKGALRRVRLDSGTLRLHAHQLSGGMKQRVLLAMALLLEPRLLIADEPTSGLDDDSTDGVFEALDAARAATGCALLLITHDLRLVRRHAERVVVLEHGRVVEEAATSRFFDGPRSAAGRALRDAALYLGDEAA